MKDLFNITGSFYENEGYKFRKYLNIKHKKSRKAIPDMMVVMMNPGSSYPLNNNDNSVVETEANPDNTQDQIMKVMINCKVEYARILNLSDVRDGKQLNLFKAVEEMDAKGMAHSIFDSRRKIDYDELFVREIPTLFAWGVDKRLRSMALKAIVTIGNINPAGIRKDGTDYGYYHPLPYSTPMQEEWVQKITIQLKNMQ